MKIIRRLSFAPTSLGLGLILALAALNSGCERLNQIISKDKLNQGAIAYNQGRNKEAQAFFKGATERDPNSPIAWLYYGATLVKDYKPLTEPQRTEAANRAIDAYQKALNLANGNCKVEDNAISYLASIYDDLGKEDEWRNWLLKRASSSCAKKETKAVTYYSIAQKYWNCSYDQTTRYQDKAKLGSDPFHYRNMDYPAAQADRQKAEDCVTKGLEYMEKALAEDPEYVDALFYKGLLYRERQKLTKDEAKRKELDAMAKKISDDATALQKKKEAAAPSPTPAA